MGHEIRHFTAQKYRRGMFSLNICLSNFKFATLCSVRSLNFARSTERVHQSEEQRKLFTERVYVILTIKNNYKNSVMTSTIRILHNIC